MGSKLLVLESVWHSDLHDGSTVRPFIEGWAAREGISAVFRPFYDRAGFFKWMRLFALDESTRICYVAGHGAGNRLAALNETGINLSQCMERAFPRRGAVPDVCCKGVLLGACDVGNTRARTNLLDRTKRSLSWIAGYEGSTPWTESTLCDLMFLTYMVRGRCRRASSDGESRLAETSDGSFEYQNKASAEKCASWVRDDFSLAVAMGFNATQRA